MPRKKRENIKESKPFDSMLKALFGEQAEEIISCLLPDSYRPEDLPTMKHATVDLLTRAVRELNEYYDHPRFVRHLLWFHTMLWRTTTISQEDKQKIEEVLKMQYPGYALFRENPVIHGMIQESELKGKAEGRIEGKIEGIQDSILDVVKDDFSPPVVAQVQQTITLCQDVQLLRKFLRQVVRLSDEQEVLALLTECFPLPGEVRAAQEMILDVVSDSFLPDVADQVRQAITPCQDVQLLRKFHRQVVRLSDEQEVSALLAQFFPTPKDAQ